MLVFPNAKINIGLNVIEKRPDGFHNIETIFYPVKWLDALEIIEKSDGTEEDSFSTSGLEIPGNTSDNLVSKAIQIARRHTTIPPLQIHLHKNIPFGSGLGGGSSDAASALKILNNKYEVFKSQQELLQAAAELGSDCAFFIHNEPCYAHGKGEKIETMCLDLKRYFLVLIVPPIHVGTKEAYGLVKPHPSEFNLKNLGTLPVDEWKNYLSNSFEAPIFIKHPEISEIKSKLYEFGALFASMSGSGSSVFGIFKYEIALKKEFKDHSVFESYL